MNPTVPIELFDRIDEPVFVTDKAGRLEYWNRAAETLLAFDASSLGTRPCWEIARFRTPGGEALCRPNCPVHKWVRETSPSEAIPIQRPDAAGRLVPLELLAFAIPSSGPKRDTVFHLLKSDRSRPVAPSVVSETIARNLGLLTRREREVLDHLSSGMTTTQIAEALFVSPTTVRNHIRNLLSKLGVHHRIEAILAWILLRDRAGRE